jgi:large subunit ribosomal protein L22
VLGLIRGLDVEEAREVLRFCERGAADEVGKLLDSAIANAEHNDNLPVDELFVARCWADEGPTMKRFRPRARGRGTRIRKRTSHVTIVVARYSDDELMRRRARDAASGGAADRRRRLQRRRRVAAQETAVHEHDHDHEHEAPEADAAVDEAAVEEAAVEETTAAEETGAEETAVDETTEESAAETDDAAGEAKDES